MNVNNGKTQKSRGRPAKGREPSITLRLPNELIVWIDQETAASEVGRSEMVRRLIEESRLDVPGELRRVRTAYHEAGHAVVARALGVEVLNVSIVADDIVLGSVSHKIPTRIIFFETDVVETHLMILMAGRESEKMNLGFFHNDGGDRRDRRDMKPFIRLYKTAKGAKVDESLEELRNKTVSLVMIDFKESIRQVARALLSAKTLDQKRLDQIIAKTGEKADPRNKPRKPPRRVKKPPPLEATSSLPPSASLKYVKK